MSFLQTAAFQCDTVEPFTGFDAAAYMGQWYGIAHTRNSPFQDDSKVCNGSQYYNLDEETGMFLVYNSTQDDFDSPRSGLGAKAKCPADGAGEGQCAVAFSPAEGFSFAGYEIVFTDYDNFAVVYGCGRFPGVALTYILSRTPVLDEDLLKTAQQIIAEKLPNYNMDDLYYDTQDLEKCTYPEKIPEVPDEPWLTAKAPVVCDTVEPFKGFDGAAYMGTWYETAHSRGQPYQDDSWVCVSANYSGLDAETGRFDVYNSNQVTLDTPRVGINAVAQCPADGADEGQCTVQFFGA